MKRKKYDLHLAGEDGGGDTNALKQALVALGFSDDNLAERHLTFDPETEKHYVACPLINIHSSIKVDDLDRLKDLEKTVDKLMRDYGVIGYWHSESIEDDRHILPSGEFIRRLPFARLLSWPRPHKKKWDIHISLREDMMQKALGEILLSNGLYYMSRKKMTADGEARFAVYTVQGVSNAIEGERFFEAICKWFERINAPPCDIKLEITRKMELVNKPHAVPPTIDKIDWIE